ncbi:MAG: hypothetical protein WD830_09705 [Chloroflexota bacterium]
MIPSIAPRIALVVLMLAACSIAHVGQPTPSPATAPSPSTEPPPQPTPTEDVAVGTEPPDGTLRADGAAVAGQHGSYCFADTCADIGGWPNKPDLPLVEVSAADQQLEFALPDSVQFVEWHASYSASSNGEANDLAEGGNGYDPDKSYASPWPATSSVTFDSPPAGDWVVYVSVYFDGGDLSYAWHVIVG